jgi:hypothetical protein
MISVAAYPHQALRAPFSREREKGFRLHGKSAAFVTAAARPLSRLRERAGVRVSHCVRWSVK